MKVVVTQYEIKKAIEAYVEAKTKLKTKTFPQIIVNGDKITAEIEVAVNE